MILVLMFVKVYQLLGDMSIEFDASHASYVKGTYLRELDLDTATAKVKYVVDEVEFTREYFASYPDQAIVLKLSASKPGSISFTASLDSKLQNRSYINAANQIIMEGSCPERRKPPTVNIGDKPKGIQFTAVLKVVISEANGGIKALDDSKLVVTDSDWAILVLVASSSFDGPFTEPSKSRRDPTSESIKFMDSIGKLAYSDLLTRHLDDYQSLFHRVSLKLSKSVNFGGKSLQMMKLDNEDDDRVTTTAERVKSFQTDEDPSMVELLFQYGRYLLIACSRPGTQPANLQGIWNKDIEPPWE